MRAIKHPDTTYTSLHHCLEAHFGERNAVRNPNSWKYCEAEQGRLSVPFQSSCPLQLDYMRRRRNDSLIRTALGFINLKRHTVK